MAGEPFPDPGIPEAEYRRRIRAWTLYDWANSAFATTILAAVLPVYYSQVAGATLPSAAVATAYWTTTLSISLVIVAVFSPILGTIADIMQGKKKFLSLFVGLGVLGTALLVTIDSGEWLLASIFFVVGRVGFASANVFYDALLPHVAREEDRDRVSTRGYAVGYLGGGLLLAVNVVMIQVLPGNWGARLAFLSVAVWWAGFSIPIFRRVPEPPAAAAHTRGGAGIVAAGFTRLAATFRSLRRYRQLFRFLVAFLIYNDGIGTIIGVAAIYGAELGFGSLELVAAILLVQLVGIPFSLIFGRIASPGERRQSVYLAFVLFNLVTLPLVGIVGAKAMDARIVGALPAPYRDTPTAVGQGRYRATDLTFSGAWRTQTPDELGGGTELSYALTGASHAAYELAFNGRRVELTYREGPDGGIWRVLIDGTPALDRGQPVEIDSYRGTLRYDVRQVLSAEAPGEHVLTVVNTGRRNPSSSGTVMAVGMVSVHPPIRESNLMVIVLGLLALQVVGLPLAFAVGPALKALAGLFDTKRTIILSLVVYAVIAIWGFFLDTVIEFWFLAWMVAVVQGGSQALSRSLYAGLSPTLESGEFFGFFSVMSKFSAILGPLLFAGAVTVFGSSRPAILSVIAFFIVGIALLARVDVDEGRRVASQVDAELRRGRAAGEPESRPRPGARDDG